MPINIDKYRCIFFFNIISVNLFDDIFHRQYQTEKKQ